jgi:hypothetical protein
MATIFETGRVTLNSGTTGANTITTTKFSATETIKAVMFWGGGTNGSLAHQGIGFATGSSEQGSIAAVMTDGVGANDSGNRNNFSRAWLSIDTANIRDDVNFTSFGTNQINFSHTQLSGTDTNILYWAAFGGTDVSAHCRNWNAPGAGSHSETGVGFQPNVGFCLGSGLATDDTAPGFHGDGMLSFWGPSNQRALMAMEQDTTDRKGHRTEQVAIHVVHGDLSTVIRRATFTSWDAGGFTLNFTDSAASTRFTTLLLNVPDAEVGHFASPAVSSTVTIPLGFGAKGAFFLSGSSTGWAQTITTGNRILMLGASDDTTDHAHTLHGVDNVNPTQVGNDEETADCVLGHNTSDAIVERATAQFNGNDLDVVYSTADSTLRGVAYLALGSTGPVVHQGAADLSIADWASGGGTVHSLASADLPVADWADGAGTVHALASADLSVADWADGGGTVHSLALADLSIADWADGLGLVIEPAFADLPVADWADGAGSGISGGAADLSIADWADGVGTGFKFTQAELSVADWADGAGLGIRGASSTVQVNDWADGVGALFHTGQSDLSIQDWADGAGTGFHVAQADLQIQDWAFGFGTTGVPAAQFPLQDWADGVGLRERLGAADLAVADWADGTGGRVGSLGADLAIADWADGAGAVIQTANINITLQDWADGLGTGHAPAFADIQVQDWASGDGRLAIMVDLQIQDWASGNGFTTVVEAPRTSTHYPSRILEHYPERILEHYPQ